MKTKLTTSKIKLTNPFTKHVIYTCCGVQQYLDNEQLLRQELQELRCNRCNEPIVVRGSNDVWYYVGEKVFKP